MNNDGNGALYRDNTTMGFEKGDIVGRALTDRNFRRSMSQMNSADNLETELIALNNMTDALEKINDQSKARLNLIKEQKKLQNDLAKAMLSEARDDKTVLELTEKIQKAKLKAAKEYLDVSDKERDAIEETLKKTQELLKVQKQLASVSWAKNLSKGLSDISKELSTVSQALSLDKLVKGNVDTWRSIRQSSMASFGLNSNQFNQFKNDVIKQVQNLNNNVGVALYGINDVTNYMSNLDKLGIHSTSLAEELVEASIVGNKILGMSVETQAQFIKTMKRTDNKELLQRQNETVAALLQSNLKVSREQLDVLSSNTASLVDQMASLGYSNEVMNRLGTTGTAAQAMVTAGYGLNAGDAIYKLFSEYYNGNTEYVGSRLSGSYNKFSEAMESGDAGTALEAILSSDMYRKYAAMPENEFRQSAVAGGLNAQDLQIIQMIRDNGNKLNWTEFEKTTKMSSEEANKKLADIQKEMGKGLTIQEKFENWMGLKLWSLPWEAHMSLADMAYWTFLASKFLDLINGFSDPGSILHKGAFGKLADAIAGIKTGTTTTGALVKAALPVIGGIAMVIGGLTMGIFDMKKAIESGLNPIRAFFCGSGTTLWNVLWNILKYVLIGVGAAILLGVGGIPLAIVAGIAALLGGITGWFGMKKNKQETEAVKGGVGGANLGTAADGFGIGGGDAYTTSAGISTKPWRISSRFGPRKPFKTSNGNWSSSYHKGIDLARKGGTPIGANAAGYVTGKGTNGSMGNWTTITDASGLKHTYMHMKVPALYSKGTYVNEGQTIGFVGTTGNSTGNHLHYQINKGSKAINPEPYITRNIMDASSSGKVAITQTKAEVQKKSEGVGVLGKFISEDTKQKVIYLNTFFLYYIYIH